MNLNNTNEILDELLRSGKITAADIVAIAKKNPTNEMKRIVDLVHGVFCAAGHDIGTGGGCEYYLEENDLKPWHMTEHQVWLEVTIEMMRQLDIKSEKEFIDCFRAAKKVKEEIQSLTPQAQDLLQRLIKIP